MSVACPVSSHSVNFPVPYMDPVIFPPLSCVSTVQQLEVPQEWGKSNYSGEVLRAPSSDIPRFSICLSRSVSC